MGGRRVDCMIPQKATRTDLFIWSKAAIVSVSGVAAICIRNASLDGSTHLRALADG